MFGLRWIRSLRLARQVRPTRPLLPPDEPVYTSAVTTESRPDGTILIVVSCAAEMPWSGETIRRSRLIPLREWSALTDDQRAEAHAAVAASVARHYRAAWRAEQWRAQAETRSR